MHVLFYDKFTSWEMGTSPHFDRHFNMLFTIFWTSISDFKASALDWSHIFHGAWIVWRWSPVRHCTNNLSWKMLASRLFSQSNVHVMLLKQSLRLRDPFCLKRPVRLSARNSCIKFGTYFRNFFIIIRKAFNKWKNAVK